MPRLSLRIQVGVVVALFLAALVSLWMTTTSVIEHEWRRTLAKGSLDRAGDALAREGSAALATAPHWPDYLTPKDWDALDRRLRAETRDALRAFPEVEGGYFLRDYKRFLGTMAPAGLSGPASKKASRIPKGPPPREADLVEIQVDAAIRKDQVLFVVEILPPSIVAIRTAPVALRGRVIGATWTMTRLFDPHFLDRPTRGYRLAAGLALGGIALALVLMVGLLRTIRHQRVERERLQTELRRSERLAALGKLVAGVAHEVRNPLAGIRSTIQLWQRGIGPDEESFEGLLAEADRLEGLVARLLHFSRADAQDLAPGDLNAVIAEVARLARGQADAQGVRIELDLEPALPEVLLAPPALVQVFRNLTTNALQVMTEGGVLGLATCMDPSRGVVEASVTDTGPGISQDVALHLFEPFFTTKPGGTGLGLAIAREIALAHRGDLRCEPRRSGAGTVFTLSLPTLEGNRHGATDVDRVPDRARDDPGGGRR